MPPARKSNVAAQPPEELPSGELEPKIIKWILEAISKIKGQKQLSKEFVRQWLITNGFQGKEGQQVPEMTDVYVDSVSDRYIELFENITGTSFQKADVSDIQGRIEQNVLAYLKNNI